MEIKKRTWTYFTVLYAFLSFKSVQCLALSVKTPATQMSENETQTKRVKVRDNTRCEADVVVPPGETKEIASGVERATLYLFPGDPFESIHIVATFNKDVLEPKRLTASDLCLNNRTAKWHKISIEVISRGQDTKALRISANCAMPAEEELAHKTKIYSYKNFHILAEGSSFWRNSSWPSDCPNFELETSSRSTRVIKILIVVFLTIIIGVVNGVLILIVARRRRIGELDGW
uniref:uncharacterized protein n=1 Tax=Palaemon carinicauda TaxID=392227 RepID=UPI0035B64F1D